MISLKECCKSSVTILREPSVVTTHATSRISEFKLSVCLPHQVVAAAYVKFRSLETAQEDLSCVSVQRASLSADLFKQIRQDACVSAAEISSTRASCYTNESSRAWPLLRKPCCRLKRKSSASAQNSRRVNGVSRHAERKQQLKNLLLRHVLPTRCRAYVINHVVQLLPFCDGMT